jgi:phospholipid/cholesterol/gamma-HCH transport system permease protein
MLSRVFRKPDKWRMFRTEFIREVYDLGVNSIGIVAFISVFVGAVVALQLAYNIQDSPLLPDWYIGYATRESIILEFSPTIISLILAGKVGSSISSNIGTMRTSEQIDALDIMGVNSANFLILPKLLAAMFFNPFLIVMSMAAALFGGMATGWLTDLWAPVDYLRGITDEFRIYNVTYALIKTVIFAFVITSIPAYHGYYTRGGALDVGRSSTKAVVYSSITLIALNYLLTQILL